jgi:hypothetical protein
MDALSILDELKWSLQALAMSPELQREQFPSFVCIADELALEFDHSWKTAADNHSFTPEQRSVLTELDAVLGSISGREHAQLWTEQAMRDAPEWQQIRGFARRALESLSWPEEIPPKERLVYVRGREA